MPYSEQCELVRKFLIYVSFYIISSPKLTDFKVFASWQRTTIVACMFAPNRGCQDFSVQNKTLSSNYYHNLSLKVKINLTILSPRILLPVYGRDQYCNVLPIHALLLFLVSLGLFCVFLFAFLFSIFADMIYNPLYSQESFPFCLFIQGMSKSRSYFDAGLLG